MKKKIICLVGIAASGKSTYSNKILAEYDGGKLTAYINADSIREDLYGDPMEQGDPKVVFKRVFDDYTRALKSDYVDLIIIDNTSLKYDMRKRYYKLADIICPALEHEFEYHLIFFKPDLQRSLEWNKNRDRHVPDKVIEDQFNRYQGPTEKEKQLCIITEI